MNPQSPANELLVFGDFELDPVRLELRRGGRSVRLRPQPARLLALLARQSGRPVSRESIQAELWGDQTVVEFDQGLKSCIRQIRSALGDSADSPRFVKTLPRLGYEFLADVRSRPSTPGGETPPHADDARPIERLSFRGGSVRAGSGDDILSFRRSQVRRRIHPKITWGLLAVLAIVLIAMFQLRDAIVRRPAPMPDDGRVMIAVLPFENLSGDLSQEYLADGMTEELIFQLARLHPERLGVIARTSVMGYKGAEQNVAAIGDALGVEYVLEGSVRSHQGEMRVTAQLIDVGDQSHLWADTYQRNMSDLFGVQGEISHKVAESLTLELLYPERARARRALTHSPEAYDLYLQARFHWNRFDADGLGEAERLLKQALALDPQFAMGWAALADVYNLLPFNTGMAPGEGYPRAKQAALKALELDPDLAMAHNALGFSLFYYDWDWEHSEHEFARAVELDPGYAMAHHWFAGLLSALGRHDEAIAAVRRAVELDPRSLSVRSDLAWYCIFARRYEEAVAEAEMALEQEPWHGWSRYGLAFALTRLDRWDEAREQVKIQLEQAGAPPEEIARLDELSARAAIQRMWRDGVEEAERDGQTGDPYGMAVRYNSVGRGAAAIDELRRAMTAKDAWIVFVNVDPRLDGAREAPGFEAVVEEMGLASRER